MKLAEFLNDDTCQILLAIIVGIVVCYFIFGSCGTCRDGFSVGGQSCRGTRDEGGRPCISFQTEDDCLSVGCQWVDPPVPPPPTPPPNSGQTQMERDCEAYLATLSSDAGSPCEGVTLGEEGGLDSTPSCCDAVESTGGCNKDTLPDEFTTRINQEIALCSNPSTDPRQSPPTGNSPPPPPPTSISRDENIINDMVKVIQEEKSNPNYNVDDFDSYESKIEELKSKAEQYNIKFMLLINNLNNTYEEVSDINYFTYIPKIKIPVEDITNTNTLKLGYLRHTYSLLNASQQKNIYCSPFSRQGPNNISIIEPLLKMTGSENIGTDYCSDESGWQNCEPDKCNYKKESFTQVDNDTFIEMLNRGQIPNSPAIEDYKETTDNNNNYNPPSISTAFNNSRIQDYLQNPNNKILITTNQQSFTTSFCPEGQWGDLNKHIRLDTFEPNNTYELEKMYGMNMLNPGMVYQTDKPYIWNLFWVQYYINRVLFDTSKYMPKYLNRFSGAPPDSMTPQESYFDFSIDINSRPESESYNQLDQNNYTTNNGCNNSGEDYLLLVFREIPPRPQCNAPHLDGKPRYIHPGGTGCEWIDLSIYDHANCEDFVADSASGDGGYYCRKRMSGDDPNRIGHGYCYHVTANNQGWCQGELPTLIHQKK